MRQGREGLRSASKFCDMIDSLTIKDQDEDYSVPKGLFLHFFLRCYVL